MCFWDTAQSSSLLSCCSIVRGWNIPLSSAGLRRKMSREGASADVPPRRFHPFWMLMPVIVESENRLRWERPLKIIHLNPSAEGRGTFH